MDRRHGRGGSAATGNRRNGGANGAPPNILSDGIDAYTYDSLNRLTNASGSGASASYAYDPTGNRTSASLAGQTLTYSGNALNQYLSVSSSGSSTGSASYTYDRNGNMTGNGTFAFVYDYENRLVEVRKAADNSLVAQYVYDAL